MRMIRQALLLVLIGSVIGIGNDLLSRTSVLRNWDLTLAQLDLVVPVRHFPADQVAQRFRAGEVVLLDARPRVEFRRRSVAGSVSVPLDEFEQYYNSLLEKLASRDVFIVLSNEEPDVARKLAERVVTELGAASAGTIDGGYEALLDQDLPWVGEAVE